MGNAPEEVKRLARHITLDNDREGVALGLQQLNFTKNQI
jgi:hydroxymethylpyrimidine pyrophosphatase-like HAD family hydrolase